MQQWALTLQYKKITRKELCKALVEIHYTLFLKNEEAIMPKFLYKFYLYFNKPLFYKRL